MPNMKSCFSAHIILHSLFGLGLGLLLATLVPGLQLVWLAIVLMVIGAFGHVMVKHTA